MEVPQSFGSGSRRTQALYDEYGSRIFRFCLRLSGNRHDAEDLTQEVFLAAFQGIGRFRGRSSVSTWLYKIALFQWRAKRERKHRTDLPLDSLPAALALSADPSIEQTEFMAFEAALASLSTPLREAFVLVKAEGLTCQEAAHALGIPTGTLKYRVHEAICRLRAELEPAPQEDSK